MHDCHRTREGVGREAESLLDAKCSQLPVHSGLRCPGSKQWHGGGGHRLGETGPQISRALPSPFQPSPHSASALPPDARCSFILYNTHPPFFPGSSHQRISLVEPLRAAVCFLCSAQLHPSAEAVQGVPTRIATEMDFPDPSVVHFFVGLSVPSSVPLLRQLKEEERSGLRD